MAGLMRRASLALSRACNNGIQTRFQIRKYSVDFDGDVNQMRTTVTLLSQEQDEGIFMDTYSTVGFRLNSGIRIMGPCVVFPRSVLQWNVQSMDDINEESLSLFTMLEPKLDILVLGVGERENLSKVNANILKYLRSHKVNVELLSTDQALATFNFLNAEKRYVAGAFIPPSYVHAFEDDDINLGIPDHVDPAEMSNKEFEGAADDDLKPLMEEGLQKLEEIQNRSSEQENRDKLK